jgi:hypothetical protein
MPRIPMIMQEDTTTITVEELDQAKPIPEDRRRALVARMLGKEASSTDERLPFPETNEDSPSRSDEGS